jgi:hypothetical protein
VRSRKGERGTLVIDNTDDSRRYCHASAKIFSAFQGHSVSEDAFLISIMQYQVVIT